MRTLLLAFALVSIATAAMAQDPDPAKPKPPKKQANVIAAWELEAIAGQAHDAYDVVQRLRPRFFQVRSAGGAAGGDPRWTAGPMVLVNDAPRGGTEHLRTVPIDAIKEIRYLSGPDAASRYGAEYHAGAILVVTK